MKENKLKKDYFFYLGILGICLFLIMLFIYAIHFSSLTPEWLQYYFSNASNDPADWGTFGDFLGGTLNPIFGLLGFLVLIRTLSLQRQQLDDQRQAMQQQQEDMQAQRESLAISNKTQIKQQFEGTFFNLINFLNVEFNITKESFVNQGIENPKIPINIYVTKTYLNLLSEVQPIDDLLRTAEYDSLFSRILFSKYYMIFEKILYLINSLEYPDLRRETLENKNFYIDILLLNTSNAFVCFFALEFLFKNKKMSSRDVKFGISTSFKLIRELGILRNLDFSPFNDQEFEISPNQTLLYSQHPITLALVETFGEQAFKPIEVPPTNP